MSRGKRNPNEKKLLCKRFNEALSLLELKPSTAYKLLGYNTPSTLYSITAGRCLPDLTKLMELSGISSDGGYRINLDWLITGKGNKLILIQKRKKQNSEVENLLVNCSKKKLNAVTALLTS